MPDLNLLLTLDVLLTEGSVAGAARRLRLSPSAMSRALARLRQVTGDPLLVRAGRRLVPTPRAAQLRAEVGPLVEAAKAVLRPAEVVDPSRMVRRFTLRCSEGFAETFGPALLAILSEEAPGVTLQFLTKPDKDSAPLRQGEVDIETGVVDAATAPELRAVALFRDRWIGVVRDRHPLAPGPVAAADYAALGHVLVQRPGLHSGEVDEAAHAAGVSRRVAAVASGFATALALARQTDLAATVPDRHTEGLRHGLRSFELPFPVVPFTISMLWHPRMDADPGHRWLRERLRNVCGG